MISASLFIFLNVFKKESKYFTMLIHAIRARIETHNPFFIRGAAVFGTYLDYFHYLSFLGRQGRTGLWSSGSCARSRQTSEQGGPQREPAGGRKVVGQQGEESGQHSLQQDQSPRQTRVCCA